MLNLINLLEGIESVDSLCDGLSPILRIVGIVVLGIEIVVPILLIVVGMMDLAKAVVEKDEKSIKEAENKLIKKVVAAVLVFLVTYLVSLVMTLVASDDYKKCMPCIRSPFGNECKDSLPDSDDI